MSPYNIYVKFVKLIYKLSFLYFFLQIIIRGDLNSSDTKDLITCVQSLFLPHKVLILDDGRQDSFLYKKLQVLSSLEMKDGKATAYVCENYTCSLPVNTVDELKQMLSP